MKKFTIALAVFAGIGLTVVGQNLNQTYLSGQDLNQTSLSSTLSRSGITSIKNFNTKVLQKNGGAAAVNVAFTDDFSQPNDTDGLKARGYLPYYRGTGPQGSTGAWFQGDVLSWPDFNNGSGEYVCSNYNSVTATNDIDNWLVLPPLNVASGDAISFYSRSPLNSTFPDSIRVMYSNVGDSTPEDVSWIELGRFKVNTTGVWLQNSYPVATAGATARFAIRYTVVQGGPMGSNSDLIGIDQLDVYTPASFDGGVISINNLSSGCSLSSTTTINITISNFGATTLTSVPVSYSINGGIAVAETYTGSIATGATDTYTFTASADLSVAGSYTISANTAIPSDGNTANDAASTIVNSLAPNNLSSPLFVSFEPTDDLSGWLIGDDVNADGNTWAVVSSAQFNGVPHTGTQAIRIGATGAGDDDWTYTTCLDLSAGTNYNLDFWYKKFDGAAVGCDFGAYVGISQTAAGMTQMLVNGLQSPDSNYVESTTPFSVAATGTYYVGFHATSTAAATSSRIDDVTISIITGINNIVKNSDLIAVFPSPASVDLNINLDQSISDANIEIYNSLGGLVKTLNNVSGSAKVDVSAFAKGIYTLKVFAGDKVLSQRFSVAK